MGFSLNTGQVYLDNVAEFPLFFFSLFYMPFYFNGYFYIEQYIFLLLGF